MQAENLMSLEAVIKFWAFGCNENGLRKKSY